MRLSLLNSNRVRTLLPALGPPAAIFGVWIFTLGSEPSSVSAGIDPEPLDPMTQTLNLPPRPCASNDVARAARARMETIRLPFDFSSPFFRPTDEQTAPDDTDRLPAMPPIDVVVSSLMNTRHGAIAVINATPYRVGDRIEDIATVKMIDVASRTVIITLDDGASVEVVLEQPGATNPD